MTLTETAYWTRKFAVLGAIVLVILIIAITAIVMIDNREIVQPEYAVANFACTQDPSEMPRLKIKSIQLPASSKAEIVLNTVKGDVEILPRIINVYKFQPRTQSLSALQRAKAFAATLGFDPDTVVRKRNSSIYEWTNRDYGNTLTITADTMNFVFKTDFSDLNKAFPYEKKLPSDEDARATARAFLKTIPEYDDSYDENNTLIRYISISPDGSFTEGKSRSDADLIRVDFYRKQAFMTIAIDSKDDKDAEKILRPYEKMFDIMHNTGSGNVFYTVTEETVNDPVKGQQRLYQFETRILPEDPNSPLVSVYVGPPDPRKREARFNNVYGAEVTSWKIETPACGTYELIPSIQVVSMLKEKGSLVSLIPKTNPDTINLPAAQSVETFSVQNIYLAYIETKEFTPFLQPIWVATGEAVYTSGDKGSFMYYLPAINYDIISTPVETAPAAREAGN